MIKSGNISKVQEEQSSLINKIYADERFIDDEFPTMEETGEEETTAEMELIGLPESQKEPNKSYEYVEDIEEEESLSLQKKN